MKIFDFQFDESVTKFYVVKSVFIFLLKKFLYTFGQIKNGFLVGTRKKFTSITFSSRGKTEKCHFWPPLHKSKFVFHEYEGDLQNFIWFKFKIQAVAMTTRNFKKIYWLEVQILSLKNDWRSRFLIGSQFLRSMGNLRTGKSHKNFISKL